MQICGWSCYLHFPSRLITASWQMFHSLRATSTAFTVSGRWMLSCCSWRTRAWPCSSTLMSTAQAWLRYFNPCVKRTRLTGVFYPLCQPRTHDWVISTIMATAHTLLRYFNPCVNRVLMTGISTLMATVHTWLRYFIPYSTAYTWLRYFIPYVNGYTWLRYFNPYGNRRDMTEVFQPLWQPHTHDWGISTLVSTAHTWLRYFNPYVNRTHMVRYFKI